ncbi:MAG: hypothetical protein JSR77_17265 [Planctomycetes bacterium]|nr:hypothetical protein [Planctomycetota bacterium]
MSVVVVANPNSGRGTALSLGREIAAAHGAEMVETRPGSPAVWLAEVQARLTRNSVCVVVGGDGTLHSVLPALVASGAAVYHAARGTENLFARQFGMVATAGAIATAIAAARTMNVDVGECTTCEGERVLFTLMVSSGPDAGVARRLALERRGAITHMSYAVPMMEELLRPSLPRMRVEVDGRVLVQGRGWLVIANSSQYGARIDPAREASMTDGLLDVVFFPARTGLAALGWLAASRLGWSGSSSSVFRSRGKRIRVETDLSVLQADGDWIRESGEKTCKTTGDNHGPFVWEAGILPAGLKVLLPS